jgi:hypothetical protein
MTKLLPPPVQQVGVDFKGAGDLSDRRPGFQLLDRSHFQFPCELPSSQTHEKSPFIEF